MFWIMLLLARQARGWRAATATLRRLAPRCSAHFEALPPSTTKDVLDYWFTDAEARQRWFASTAAFDRRVADKRKQLAAPAAGEGAAEAPRKRARPEDSSPPQVSQDWEATQET